MRRHHSSSQGVRASNWIRGLQLYMSIGVEDPAPQTCVRTYTLTNVQFRFATELPVPHGHGWCMWHLRLPINSCPSLQRQEQWQMTYLFDRLQRFCYILEFTVSLRGWLKFWLSFQIFTSISLCLLLLSDSQLWLALHIKKMATWMFLLYSSKKDV